MLPRFFFVYHENIGGRRESFPHSRFFSESSWIELEGPELPYPAWTFILTWSFLQDMCKLNDIHARWCHQVTFLVEQKINDGEMLWNFIHEVSIGFLFLRVMFFDDPFLPEITSPSTNHHLVTLFGEFWMCFASVITCFFCILASKCSGQYRNQI